MTTITTQFTDINGKTLKTGNYFYMENQNVLDNENPTEPTHYLDWDELVCQAGILEVEKVGDTFQPKMSDIESGKKDSLIELMDREFVIL